MKQKYIDRFHTKYEIDSVTGCWNWTGGLLTKRYGAFNAEGKTWYAHRFSAVIYNLDMSGEVMRHTCDNMLCVNPAHLITGSREDNMKDRDSRNRQSKGITHGCAKLSEQQVLDIRQIYSSRCNNLNNISFILLNPKTVGGLGRRYQLSKTQIIAQLAVTYQLSKTQIRSIINRKSWSHI